MKYLKIWEGYVNKNSKEDLINIFLEYEKSGSVLNYDDLRSRIYSFFDSITQKPVEIIQDRIDSLNKELEIKHQGNEYYEKIINIINELEDLKSDFIISKSSDTK